MPSLSSVLIHMHNLVRVFRRSEAGAPLLASGTKIAHRCKRELAGAGIVSTREVVQRFNLVVPGRQFDARLPTMMFCCRGSYEAIDDLLFRDVSNLVSSTYLGAKAFVVIPGTLNKGLINIGKQYSIAVLTVVEFVSFAELLSAVKSGSETATAQVKSYFKGGGVREGVLVDDTVEPAAPNWASALLWESRN
jgi:hypothetical protein